MRSNRRLTLTLFAFVLVSALSAMSAPVRYAIPKGAVFIRVSGGTLQKPIVIVNSSDVATIENGLYLDNAMPRTAAANSPPLQLAFFWNYKYAALAGSPDSLARVHPDSANQWVEVHPPAKPGDPAIVTYRARVVRTERDGKTYIESWGDERVGQPWALQPWAVARLEQYLKAKR
jgi:hypothetical protein